MSTESELIAATENLLVAFAGLQRQLDAALGILEDLGGYKVARVDDRDERAVLRAREAVERARRAS